MPTCLHFKALHQGGGASVSSCRCRPSDTAPGAEELSSESSIVFVRRGAFVKHLPGETVVADASRVLFFRPGMPYRVSHVDTGGDDCTIIRLSPGDWHSAAQVMGVRVDPHEAPPVPPFPDAPAGAETDLLHRRLFHALQRNCHALGAEETAIRLATSALDAARRARTIAAERRPVRTDTVKADRDRVAAAQGLLAARFRENLSLDQAARAAHCSAFHLSRTFKRETGLTIRQYVARLRLSAAIESMLEGAKDLTRVALDAGFYDHAHFTNSFTQFYGMPPSVLRRSELAGLRSPLGVPASKRKLCR